MISFVIDALLLLVVLSAWLGVLGMLRMREPTQALHYVSVPASVGVLALLVAVALQIGVHAATFKMICIALTLFAINAVVAHATARAFRVRSEGQWQHRHGDDMTIVRESRR